MDDENIREWGKMPPDNYFVRNYMGLTPDPDYDVLAKTMRNISTAMYQRTNAYFPWHEVIKDFYEGTRFSPHKNDVDFYKFLDYFKQIGNIDIATHLVLDPEGVLKYFKIESDPVKKRFYSGSGDQRKVRLAEQQLSAAFMLRAHYASIALRLLSDGGKTTYSETMRMFEPTSKQVRVRKRAMMAKMQMGKKPNVSIHPQRYPIQFQGHFTDEMVFFAATNTWAVLCGLLKPGEFFDKAAGLGTHIPHDPLFVQIALHEKKEPFPHIEAIFWWDDPPFPPSYKGSRMFLLFGLTLDIIGTPKDSSGKWVRPGLVKQCFLALECPTAGVMRLPIAAPGLPLYRKQVYDLWQDGRLSGIRVGGLFLTIFQNRPDFGVLPAIALSAMPEAKLFFGAPHGIKWKGNL